MENWHFHLARDGGDDVYCSGSFSNRIPRNCFQFWVHHEKKSWNKNPIEEHIYRWIWKYRCKRTYFVKWPKRISQFCLLSNDNENFSLYSTILNRIWLFAFHGHKRIFNRSNNKSVSILFVCDCICIFCSIKAQHNFQCTLLLTSHVESKYCIYL